jgi:hypothetical protein
MTVYAGGPMFAQVMGVANNENRSTSTAALVGTCMLSMRQLDSLAHVLGRSRYPTTHHP